MIQPVLTHEIKLLFLFLNPDKYSHLDIQFLQKLKKTVWKNFETLAVKHGLAAEIYFRLNNAGKLDVLPEFISNSFKQQYYKIFAVNTVFSENLRLIAGKALQQNIDIILLKGIALTVDVYDNAGLRLMNDMDILIKHKDIPAVTEILKSLGYYSNPEIKSEFISPNRYKAHYHLPAFVNKNNRMMLELHTHIHPANGELKLDISEFWKNKGIAPNFPSNVFLLSTENLLLHLCVHINEHAQFRNLRLAHFYDLVKIIRKQNINPDWINFIDDVKKFNLFTAVIPQLFLINKYFNIELPDFIVSCFNSIDKSSIEQNFFDIILLKKHNFKELSEFKKEEIKNIKGVKNKMLYISGDLFPSKRFMLRRYQIKNSRLFGFYYVFRWISALNRIFFMVIPKKK